VIARLEGVLLVKEPTRVLVDVNGVGYEALIPLSTFARLPDEGKTVALRIHTHLRDDALQLFGFASDTERVAFDLLLHANRVGPKLAQTILSGIEADELIAAIRTENVATLRSVPGIGAKTAERIVLDLRDRAQALRPPPSAGDAPEPIASAAARDQLVSALVNLQVTRAQAERVVERVITECGEEAPIEVLVRAALRSLAR
jgi:Holliday junction DNA helicase RuvA